MKSFTSWCSRYTPLLARIFMALVFLYAGIGKLIGFSETAQFLGSIGLPVPMVLLAIGTVLELGGGILLLIGFKTKWAANALILFVALTIVLFHSNVADQAQMVNALKNLAIIGGLSMFAVHGAGAWSLDNRKKKMSVSVSESAPQV